MTSRQQNASVHDSQQFDGLLNQANTSSDVYAEHARFAQPDSSARERQSSPSQEQEHPPPYDAGAVGCRIKDESARSAQTGAWAHAFTTNQGRKMTVAPQRRSTRRKMRHCSRCPIDDLGLCRMHLKSARLQPRSKLGPNGLCFLLGPAVHQSVVSIPTLDRRANGREPRELALGHGLRNPLASIDKGAAL